VTTEPSTTESLEGCLNRYRGKVTLVTGGSKGIGEGCARCFFEAGSNVVVASRDPEIGVGLVKELNERAI
jgi:NAD(P)-dependent dehydrogenase (short-subunit alcohol dehydrogenase family)